MSQCVTQIQKDASHSMGKRVAVFDINGTLIAGNLGVVFVKHLFARGLLSMGAMLRIGLLYPLVKLGLVDFSVAIKMGGWALKGLKVEVVAREAARCFEEQMCPRLFQDGMREIARLQSQGVHTVLATGGIATVSELFRRQVGADALIAAREVIEAGRYTGELESPLPYREGKRDLVRQHLDHEGLGDAEVTVYTDTAKDLALLEAADRVVAVNADACITRFVSAQGGRVATFE